MLSTDEINQTRAAMNRLADNYGGRVISHISDEVRSSDVPHKLPDFEPETTVNRYIFPQEMEWVHEKLPFAPQSILKPESTIRPDSAPPTARKRKKVNIVAPSDTITI